MCFDVPTLVPPSIPLGSNGKANDGYDSNDKDLGIMDIDGDDTKSGK